MPARERPPAGKSLFDSAVESELASRAPLAARMRPRDLDQFVGQRHLLAPGGPLRALVDADRLSSAILWGPPGTGKTSFARLLAGTTSRAFESLSAVTAGVKDVREVIEGARRRLATDGTGTILFLDEVHRFNKAQQDALLPGVEEGLIVLVGATTENPFFSLNSPLLSRSTLWRFEPLQREELALLAARGLETEGATASPEAVEVLVELADGDARAVLTTLEVAVALGRVRAQQAGDAEPRIHLEVADVEAARTTRAIRHGRDEHYDVVSALIKSIRGSDADAGLYWLARLVAAGEDPRFIARRLVILASEDVGMADSNALLVADAAARAVEFVGMPEAGLNLAHAVIRLAMAPKSNRSAAAWWAAQKDVEERPPAPVPAPLKGAGYWAAASLGHGVGYEYPHDHPGGWIPADYRVVEDADRIYYEPSANGGEATLGELLAERRRQLAEARERRRRAEEP